ncbi:hypothetical protein GIB67_019900 [Kingdonia uniflora]|uniref:Uncharacterized protein n=1 Tax=Kingdonia uniflora TaxID=39325 RepID=A0A7J7MKP8_9MAGN|nr:hypothetical protein GIB67_019900 [Kingdonia uniflora]
MNEDNVEAPPMSDPPQTEVSQKQKETAAPIDDTYPPDRSLPLSFKFHRARSIYLGQMEVSGELSNVCEHEQYLMLRDENRALVEQISALKEEVKKLKDQKKQKNEKVTSSLITEKLTEKTKESEALNEQNAKLVKDLRIQTTVDDCNTSLSRELAKKTKECQVLNVQNTKLVEDLRIKIGVDASNVSMAIELAKQRRECKLLQDINAKLAEQSERQYPEPIPKKINELTVKYEDVVKRLKEKESFMLQPNTPLFSSFNVFTEIIVSNYWWTAKYKSDTAKHDKKIETLHSQLIIVEETKKTLEVKYYKWEAWRQAIKKEFHSRQLTEKDDQTFIELFDQYERFYTIAQQGPKCDYQEDFTVTGGNHNKLMEVKRANVVLKKKINEILF